MFLGFWFVQPPVHPANLAAHEHGVVVSDYRAAWSDVDLGIFGVPEMLACDTAIHAGSGRKKTRHSGRVR